MHNPFNITKKSASLFLILSLFLLPLTSGYVSLNCDIRQETGLSCCGAAESACCSSESYDFPAYRQTPCCPCETITVQPSVLPDVEFTSSNNIQKKHQIITTAAFPSVQYHFDRIPETAALTFESPPAGFCGMPCFQHPLRI